MNDILWLTLIILSIVIFFILVFYENYRYNREKEGIIRGGGSQNMLYDRYVKGEITIDQYQMMRKDLEDRSPEKIVEKFSRYF